MKDLQLTDVFSSRADKRKGRVSVYRNGFWSFGFPRLSSEGVVDGILYRRSMEKFGILSNDQNDPSRPLDIGKPGDYIAEGQGRQFSLVTAETYDILYPKKVSDTDEAYLGSSNLKDGDFLTGVVEKYKD